MADGITSKSENDFGWITGFSADTKSNSALAQPDAQLECRPRTRAPFHWRLLLAGLALAVFPASVRGIGLSIPNQDAFANARGNAFAATADNPSALYYNPAGITQIPGLDIQVGVLNYLGLNTHYRSPSGSTANTKFEVLPVPQIYISDSPTHLPFSFGLGFYAPFGLGVVWPQDSGFQTLARESRLQYLTLNPVVAWKMSSHLSLAAGLTVDYAKLKLNRGFATASDTLDFSGSGLAYGFNAGVLWQPLPRWSFGANYRSATTLNFDGTTLYNPGSFIAAAPTTARANFPHVVSGGISFRPTPKWNLEADVDWRNWSCVRTIVLSGTRNIFGFDLPLTLNWRDSWFYECGITRYFEQGWFASVGYFYCTETASDAYFTPAVPDAELHVACLGFGHQGKAWRWALAAQYIASPSRTISGSQPNPFTGASADGTYQLSIPTISLSVSRHF